MAEPSTELAAPQPRGVPRAGARADRPATLSPALNWVFEGAGYQYVTLAVDAALLCAALAIADAVDPAPPYLAVLLVSPLTLVLLAARRLYDPRAQIGRLDLAANVVGMTAAAAIAVAGLVELAEPQATDSGLVAIQLAIGAALLLVWRLVWATARRWARRARRCGRLTLIVGAGEVGARLERHLLTLADLGLIPIGFLDADPVPAAELERREAPVLGGPPDFDAIVDETGAEQVILAFQIAPDVVLRPLVRRCEERGLDMAIVPRLFDDTTNRMVLEHVGGIPVFELRQVDPKGWQFALKHGLDRVAAALLITLLSAPLLAIAIAVRFSDGAPVLFRQRRIGRDGQEFDVLKFRTMRAASGSDRATVPSGDRAPGGVEGEDRRTGLGRFLRRWSLDELPQFINVLRGEMSLVGPRPERPELVGEFEQRIRRYEERHRVRSGITGWAQVNGLGPRTSLADRAELDNWYIQNWSFWLDVKILALTIPAALRASE